MLQQVIQAGFQSLHDQQRKLSPWEEAEPKEQCDVRVAEAGTSAGTPAGTSESSQAHPHFQYSREVHVFSLPAQVSCW